MSEISATKRPHNFDWVTERHGCQARQVFDGLKVLTAKYVDTRNKLTGSDRRIVEFSAHGDSFIVSGRIGRVVRVAKFICVADDEISIEWADSTGKSETWRPYLSHDGYLRLRCDSDDDLEPWQALRRLLEPLFFPQE